MDLLDDDMFIVDEILKKRVHHGRLEYFVRWQGYPDPADNTWEPASNLSTCPTVVEAFENKLKERKRKLAELAAAPRSKSDDEKSVVVARIPIGPTKVAKTAELDEREKPAKPVPVLKDSSSKGDKKEMNNNDESKLKAGVGEVLLNSNPKMSTDEKKSDSKKSSKDHKKTTSKESDSRKSSTQHKKTSKESDHKKSSADKKKTLKESDSKKSSTDQKKTSKDADSKKSSVDLKKTTSMDVTSKGSSKAQEKDGRWLDGFDKHLEAEKIIAVMKQNNKMVFLVQFKDCPDCYLISKNRVYQRAPLIALKFFEKHINWLE